MPISTFNGDKGVDMMVLSLHSRTNKADDYLLGMELPRSEDGKEYCTCTISALIYSLQGGTGASRSSRRNSHSGRDPISYGCTSHGLHGDTHD